MGNFKQKQNNMDEGRKPGKVNGKEVEDAQRIPELSNCMRWFGYTATVFLYEFIGTFFLVCGVIATKGNPIGIGLTLFFLLLLGGPITGAHHNPAVSIGVLINNQWNLKRLVQFFNMLAAQFIGALIGMEFLYMCIVTKSHGKNISEFPILKPEAAFWQSLCIEAMCTAVFVMANLLVKDPRSGFAGHNHGWMGCFTIASALAAMIFVAGPHSGASLNPAVSVALSTLKHQIEKKGLHPTVFRIYLLGPIIGSICAGFFSWAHRCMLKYVDAEAYFAGDTESNEAVNHAAECEAEEKANTSVAVPAPAPA